ncbi:lipase family protein [Serratia plymuthica]|uniref:lipase family protein n=1 Tax=Serratia plymuthica TaxID=82996 RepID=UPI003DA2068E
MKKTYTFDAECFALASIAWSGAHQEEYNPELTQKKLQNGLTQSPITAGKLDNVVWGPAVKRVPKARADSDNWDDYMFFVVQNRNDPTDYRVAARSTVSTLNGQEDMAVLELVNWRQFDADAPEEAKIASGMAEVLGDLLKMTANVEPGYGSTLVQFLNTHLNDGDTLTFCGHSMGGTFTPPWGVSVKQQLEKNVRVQVRSLAGATAGNAPFATRAEDVLGSGLKRIINSLDIVPKAWNADSLKEIATLYEPVVTLPEVFQLIIFGFADFVMAGYRYTHTGQPESFDSGVNPAFTDFQQQYSYQHYTAYLKYYELEMGKDIIYDPN